ncbi:hypothetical protein MIND_00550200 [Mycena indigotica]|uniref:Uncharacterized protein n=1 Tax=Mycena indigotica TaxID=2126181 RepID=A0A8H6WCN4_9AGAR|nr:uncharacterized protein MIND_00550200 [Mycena indigotica]KAF7307554.1 hypothetical protein MIND_00550200 [Mycena indigotica]
MLFPSLPQLLAPTSTHVQVDFAFRLGDAEFRRRRQRARVDWWIRCSADYPCARLPPPFLSFLRITSVKPFPNPPPAALLGEVDQNSCSSPAIFKSFPNPPPRCAEIPVPSRTRLSHRFRPPPFLSFLLITRHLQVISEPSSSLRCSETLTKFPFLSKRDNLTVSDLSSHVALLTVLYSPSIELCKLAVLGWRGKRVSRFVLGCWLADVVAPSGRPSKLTDWLKRAVAATDSSPSQSLAPCSTSAPSSIPSLSLRMLTPVYRPPPSAPSARSAHHRDLALTTCLLAASIWRAVEREITARETTVDRYGAVPLAWGRSRLCSWRVLMVATLVCRRPRQRGGDGRREWFVSSTCLRVTDPTGHLGWASALASWGQDPLQSACGIPRRDPLLRAARNPAGPSCTACRCKHVASHLPSDEQRRAPPIDTRTTHDGDECVPMGGFLAAFLTTTVRSPNVRVVDRVVCELDRAERFRVIQAINADDDLRDDRLEAQRQREKAALAGTNGHGDQGDEKESGSGADAGVQEQAPVDEAEAVAIFRELISNEAEEHLLVANFTYDLSRVGEVHDVREYRAEAERIAAIVAASLARKEAEKRAIAEKDAARYDTRTAELLHGHQAARATGLRIRRTITRSAARAKALFRRILCMS